MKDGRIETIGEGADRADSERTPRLDASGRFLVPGLIDAHVHLELDPALRSPAEQLAVAEPDRVAAMARRARSMLFAGITTTRDCGGGAHREHALRARIDAGASPGPRILCCGQPVTTPGGHCGFWGGEASSAPEIDAVVARQVERGSDWIKVMATGGVFTPGSRARDTQFSPAELERIVRVAADAGRSVAAHCHGTAGIDAALAAGVRTIEHASFAGEGGFGRDLDPALMERIARAVVWVSPTVNAGWGRRLLAKDGSPSAFFERMSECLRAQRDAGVRFIASTDAGIPGVEHADLGAGLAAFARYAELSPEAVLRSATSEAALALGVGEETGRIAPGLSADLLVLEGNPLEDLAALRDPETVIFRGARWGREDRSSS